MAGMSIKGTFEVWPFGNRLGAETLVSFHMWSMSDGLHGYTITAADGRALAAGVVPKSRSGHQNILHLLRDVMNNADLGLLGVDYIKRAGGP